MNEHQFELLPGVGVGPIKFNAKYEDVCLELGEPESVNDERCGWLSGFMIDFDSDRTVEFIEMAISDKFTALYKNYDIHRMRAIDVLAIVEKDDVYDRDDPEVGYSYIFKGLQMSLWRPTIPDDETRADATFDAIGLARNGYFHD